VEVMDRKREVFKNNLNEDIIRLSNLPTEKVFLQIPNKYINKSTGEINFLNFYFDLNDENRIKNFTLEYDI
jgi:hypothetical protein